jgi:hypothetical protein
MNDVTHLKSPAIFGYFDRPEQERPSYNPSLAVPCPHCLTPVGKEGIQTVSLMPVGGDRSYFYRVHVSCHDSASKDDVEIIEGSVIDADTEGSVTDRRRE